MTSAPVAEAPILQLHGLIAEAETFRKLMSFLPKNRRVIALDFPGAGYSDADAQLSFGFRAMADVVHEVMMALDLHRPVLLGHSHGGAVALELAQSHPESLQSLVLLCPAHPFSGRENVLVSFYLSRVGRAFAHVLPDLPDWLQLFGFRRMPGSRRDFSYEDLAPYLHTLRKPGTVDHLLRLLSTWKEDMRQLAQSMAAEPLEVPTLLLWGDRDRVVPISSAEALTRHLLHFEMLSMQGVGHLPNEEAAEECASLIAAWLMRNDIHHKSANEH